MIGSPIGDPVGSLRDHATEQLNGTPVYLQASHAEPLFEQFCETASYRKWRLLAVAIVSNHIHIVVNVHGDPEPDTILRDFKAYGSRKLNGSFRRPESGTWWTDSGSKRKLDTEKSVEHAVAYTMNQEGALFTWSREHGRTT